MIELEDKGIMIEEEFQLVKQSLDAEARKQLFQNPEKSKVDTEKLCHKNGVEYKEDEDVYGAGYLQIMGECLKEFNNALVGAEINVIIKFIEDLYEQYLEMKDLLITDREAAFQLKKEEHEHRKNKLLTENKKEKLKLDKSYCRCIQRFGKRRTYLTKEGECKKDNSVDWENYLKEKFEIQRQYEEKLFAIEKKLQFQLEKEGCYFEEELKQISFIYNKQMSEKMNHNLSVAITGFFDSAIFTTRMEKISKFEKEYAENENIRHKFFIRNEYHKFEKEYCLLINLIKSYSKSVQKMQLFEDKNTLRVPTLISLIE